jgi:membrane protein DedA with SNARE-associated domain
MPPELTSYITQYGYVAIFVLVFIQELGFPNPVPNELILMFAGYLASAHVLNFWLVILTVVLADFVGTSILFFVFYFLDEWIFAHKPKWLPVSREKIEKISRKITKRGRFGIYLGRLIPYLRSYASIAAGLLRIRPKTFLTAVFVSAVTWSGGYAIAGYFMGPYWGKVSAQIGGIQNALFAVALIISAVFIWSLFRNRGGEGAKEENPVKPE